MLVICTPDGKPLPGQTDIRIDSPIEEIATVTVTLIVNLAESADNTITVSCKSGEFQIPA